MIDTPAFDGESPNIALEEMQKGHINVVVYDFSSKNNNKLIFNINSGGPIRGMLQFY